MDEYQSNLKLTGLAEENLQARVRGTALMALSNQYGHLILTTGNKSELATGFSTLYGDSAGGYAPIKDVPEDAGLAAVPLAQRRGSGRRRARADPGADHREAARRPSSPRASSTATGCRTTPSSTRSSTATSSATSATTS